MKFRNLEIVKTIKSSEELNKKEKQDVLKRLERIFKSDKEKKKCDFEDHFSLSSAFVWIATKDGWDYWNEIDKIIKKGKRR